MAEGFVLRCAEARWNASGRLRAHVQALLDGELVAADTVRLDEAKDRRRFAMAAAPNGNHVGQRVT